MIAWKRRCQSWSGDRCGGFPSSSHSRGKLVGIISQADIAETLPEQKAGELLFEISHPAGKPPKRVMLLPYRPTGCGVTRLRGCEVFARSCLATSRPRDPITSSAAAAPLSREHRARRRFPALREPCRAQHRRTRACSRETETGVMSSIPGRSRDVEASLVDSVAAHPHEPRCHTVGNPYTAAATGPSLWMVRPRKGNYSQPDKQSADGRLRAGYRHGSGRADQRYVRRNRSPCHFRYAGHDYGDMRNLFDRDADGVGLASDHRRDADPCRCNAVCRDEWPDDSDPDGRRSREASRSLCPVQCFVAACRFEHRHRCGGIERHVQRHCRQCDFADRRHAECDVRGGRNGDDHASAGGGCIVDARASRGGGDHACHGDDSAQRRGTIGWPRGDAHELRADARHRSGIGHRPSGHFDGELRDDHNRHLHSERRS